MQSWRIRYAMSTYDCLPSIVIDHCKNVAYTAHPVADVFFATCYLQMCCICPSYELQLRTNSSAVAYYVAWWSVFHYTGWTFTQCSCPQGKSLSSRIPEDHFTSPCPCPRPWTIKSLKIVKDSAFCKQSVMYHMKSINSVTANVHEVTVKNGLLILISGITYWHISVSKPFFTVIQCCCPTCPWGKSLSSRTNLHFTNPCPCHRTLSPWQRHCIYSALMWSVINNNNNNNIIIIIIILLTSVEHDEWHVNLHRYTVNKNYCLHVHESASHPNFCFV